jgi:sugar/nucleoside kinase (ribokinase family)
MSVVCLGEALVDLIGEPPGGLPRRYEVRFGGALANVAVAARRAGAPASLAGGIGADEFGSFLRAELEREGVGTEHLGTVPEMVTPYAFVHLDESGEPRYRIAGAAIEAGLASVSGHEAALIGDAEALVFGSNTLTSEPGRGVTVQAAGEARRAGVPVLFDPNLRPRRWPDLDRAVAECRRLIDSCTVVKCNLWEAGALLGSQPDDGLSAARGLAALGPELAVITAGAGPTVAAGVVEASCSPPPVSDPQPIGAGDAVMGTLAAGLWKRDWRFAEVGDVLPEAVAAGAEACRRAGAIA